MKLYKATFLLVSLLVTAGSVTAEPVIETKIVGGDPVPSATTYPWMVLLSQSDSTSNFFCGGSLIAEKWVLTAAHCVVDKSVGSLSAFVGEYDKSTATANAISKIIVHPGYDAITSDNDIALLRLTTAETLIAPVNIITPALADTLELAADDATVDVTVIGWGGLLADDGTDPDFYNSYPGTLQEVELPYISNTECNSPTALNGSVNENMMCAGFADGGYDSCQGDSGGPLIYSDSGSWYQAGIVSWGYGCAQPDRYGVYTRVENYIDWIADSIMVTPFIHFGTWVAGKTVSGQIDIDNSTGASLIVESVESSNGSIFEVGTHNCSSVAIDETCSININFLASAVGNYSETVTVVVTGEGTFIIEMTGRIAPSVNPITEIDSELIEWAMGGDASWRDVMVTIDGGYSMQSGNISDSQSSSVFTYVNVPSGARTLHFDWKSCSEQNYDYLQLWVDNVKKDALSGDVDWNHKTIEISGAGDHVIEWRYNKDYACSSGSDAGWVDNISLDSAINSTPTHSTSCDLDNIQPLAPPCALAPPPMSSGGGALSPWFYLALGMPLLMRRRRV